MVSPVSPIVAKLYMEYFEQKVLNTATHSPRIWLRYVHDTFIIQKEDHKQNFLEHINCVDLAISFTVEGNKEDDVFPFLDTIVKSKADGRLSLYIENPPKQTNIYSGIVTIIFQPSTV